MEREEIANILHKYEKGLSTPEEQATIEAWYQEMGDEMPVREFQIDPKVILEDDFAAINRRIAFRKIKRIAIAASLLIFGSLIVLLYINTESTKNYSELIAQAEQITPGGNRATLTLDDGSTIDLSEEQNGIIIGSDNIKYTDGSNLFVIQSDSEGSLSTKQANTSERQLTLATPKGGQYQITLPDGTKVWLNAASKLKYPGRFSRENREIELQGEAYFEVAADKNKPFIVTSPLQKITVHGTHFNINDYADESVAKTVLLEGSVQVTTLSQVLSSRGTKDLYTHPSPVILTPGQQSIVSENTIKLKVANIEEAIAWRNGDFNFVGENIKNIMLELSRWYNVEVNYEGKVTQELYYGKISRNKNISEVLIMLEKAGGVHFKIDAPVAGQKERRITVMP